MHYAESCVKHVANALDFSQMSTWTNEVMWLRAFYYMWHPGISQEIWISKPGWSSRRYDMGLTTAEGLLRQKLGWFLDSGWRVVTGQRTPDTGEDWQLSLSSICHLIQPEKENKQAPERNNWIATYFGGRHVMYRWYSLLCLTPRKTSSFWSPHSTRVVL